MGDFLRIDFWRGAGSPPGGAGARAYIRMAKAYGNDDIYMRSRVTPTVYNLIGL